MAVCLGVAEADAQSANTDAKPAEEPLGVIAVNVGEQPLSRSFVSDLNPTIYGESAVVNVPYQVKNGLLLDASGGARVWRKLRAGAGFSWFSNTEQSTITAQIPHPLALNSPRTASTSSGDLTRDEWAIHVLFAWPIALSPKFDLTVAGGPSFTHVSHDLVNGITPTETAPPFTTVTIGAVSVGSSSAWAYGVNGGVDLTYRFASRFGAGLLVRYVSGSAELLTSSGFLKVDAGGLQVGGGIRYRF
jgi:hypothetical protein